MSNEIQRNFPSIDIFGGKKPLDPAELNYAQQIVYDPENTRPLIHDPLRKNDRSIYPGNK